MAARKTPSAGSKPDKLLRDALLIELNTDCLDTHGKKIKKYRRLAAILAQSGLDGKLDAIKEIWDRTEGKAAQSVALTGNDGGPISITWGGKP